MPGLEGIPNYKRKAITIARAKIYGSEEQHEAVRMSLKRIGMLKKDSTGNYVDPKHIGEDAQLTLDYLREKYDTKSASKHRGGMFVLGQTITVAELRKLHKDYAREKGLPLLKNIRIKTLDS